MVEPVAQGEYAFTLRTPTYTWLKPVIGLMVLVVSAFLFPILLLPMLAGLVVMRTGGFDFVRNFGQVLQGHPVTPEYLFYVNLGLAGMIVAAMSIVWFLHRIPVSRLLSVSSGIRWRFILACFGLAIVALAAQFAVASMLPGETEGVPGKPDPFGWSTVAFIAVIVFTTPLQAIGEEFAFRGYALQAFGALTRQPWVAILLSATLFGLAHGVQNPPLFADRFAFGLIAGYLVVKTGGLEAGIALHILNNLVAFGIALSFGSITEALNVSEASWWQIPVTVTQNGVYLVLVLLVARKMGISGRAES